MNINYVGRMTNELWSRGAAELASLIASRDVSSREVVQAHLDRIEQVNGHLNAIVRRLDESALAAADAADAMTLAGGPLPVLHGVPFTVKENIDVAGTPTTNSVVALRDAVAPRDAPIVERMRNAGAIPIGRTNLPEMGLRVHTDSALNGLARNPWHPGRTTGGSSGGEAAALASGMSPIGLGNDIGGSLRNPAHCCGVSSIKPTQHVLPFATDIPPTALGLASELMFTDGVMARRVGDVRIGFDIVRGSHPRDPYSLDATLHDVPTDRPLRVAVMAEVPGGRTDPGIASVVRSTASLLESLGHRIVETTPPDIEDVFTTWGSTLNTDLSVLQPLLEMILSPDAMRFLTLTKAQWPEPDLASAVMLQSHRYELAAKWKTFFGEHDVLLAPTWALPAFEHGFDIVSEETALQVVETFRPVMPANLFGSPAAVVPAGVVDGLPVGVQVMAWRHHDHACLSVAQMIDDAMGIATPIDPVM